jgi:phospholipase C
MPNQYCSRHRKMMALLMALTVAVGPGITPAFAADKGDSKTATPIKHVIVIVGENRSFDHLFATYVPKQGETVNNLLSEGIVTIDGKPGPKFSLATQYSADITGETVFQLSPSKGKKTYDILPAPLNGGPTDVCKDNGICNLADAQSSENGLPDPPAPYYESLTQGGTGLAGKVPDSRILGVHASAPYSTLPPRPLPLHQRPLVSLQRICQ